MKIRFLFTLSALAMLAASHGAFAATAEPKPKAAATSDKADAAAKDDSARSKLVLAKGLDAEVILKGYGKPYKIKPMEAPEKDIMVECWIYRRKASESTTQTPVGYTTVVPPMAVSPTSGSAAIYIPVTQIPIYKLKRMTTYQVTELLMVDNKLVLAKQRMEREEAFE